LADESWFDFIKEIREKWEKEKRRWRDDYING